MVELMYETLLAELYAYANRRFGDCPEREALIQEAFVALIARQRQETVADPQAFLRTVLHHKHNDWLRRKYRDAIVTSEFPELAAPEATEERSEEEYTAVRREVGRLLRIYREVTVRHYLHGHSVERIARDLDIPKGTVLSRLSTARRQLKGRLESMETYSSYSYEPKHLRVSIWGHTGLQGEPFTTVSSLIEQNVLSIAYDKPLSVQVIADTMGIPCAYLEPLVEKLVANELLGRTSGGLVYTRCFIHKLEAQAGNIAAQEALADEKAQAVWDAARTHLATLTAMDEVAAMSDKQKATLVIFAISQAIDKVVMSLEERGPLPERPDGGRWLAVLKETDPHEHIPPWYASSGPFLHRRDASPAFRVFDYQTCFGDTHWQFNKLMLRCHHGEILNFLVSLYRPQVTVREPVEELIPDFEKMHLVVRDESGAIRPTFPALTMTTYHEVWQPMIEALAAQLQPLLIKDLQRIRSAFTNRVPAHVDEAARFVHYGALHVYGIAQLLRISEKGLLPYPVVRGELPLIVVVYENDT